MRVRQILLAFIVGLLPLQAFALSTTQGLNTTDQHSYLYESEYYWPGQSAVEVCGAGATLAATPNGPTIWNSGLQPPYSLEQFMIEVLKDVAAKVNVPATNTVTAQHTLALVAFAYGEGGNLNNNDIFNPLNTSYSAADLKPVGPGETGPPQDGGVQSYTTFDQGVEATARTITGSNQDRLAAVLANPNSTAQQFMYALAYYQHYPGNDFWAAASKPPNQDSYYQSRLSLVGSTQSHYTDIASLLMGLPGRSQPKNLHSSSPLQYSFGGGSSTPTGVVTDDNSSACPDSPGAVAGNEVQTALNLSWPNGSHGLTPEQTYVTAIQQYNPGAASSYNGADCGGFVSTVMRASKADPNYPALGTSTQANYMSTHPNLYMQVPNVGNTSDLQPGDIFIINVGSGGGADGHTFIYTGSQPNGTNMAEASEGTKMPFQENVFFNDYRGTYTIYRLKS